MKTNTIVASLAAACLVLTAHQSAALAQTGPGNLTIGIYAPSVNFSDATARSQYIQGVAKAVAARTGQNVTGRAYTYLRDLKAARPDFAIIEGLCVATNNWTPLATASIGGATSQGWGLFTRGENFGQLKGKRLAYLETSCNDMGFLDNALLDSEAKVKVHFGALVSKADAAAAVAAVGVLKQADAVFVPTGAGKGLTRVFDAGSVPNPAFVQMNKSLPAAVVTGAQQAVLSYGAILGIDGWKAAVSYAGLGGQLSFRAKRPVFATPEVVRVDDQDILVIPQSKYDRTKARQHFYEPQVRP
jgi:hypothetical protein